MDVAAHWNTVYATKCDEDLSWFQANSEMSTGLITSLVPAPNAVLDVGGGQSALAGMLLDSGVERVTVLDISSAAVERGKDRSGARSDHIRWLVGDVLCERDYGEVDCWHDRAVFHFFTEAVDRAKYVEAAARTVPEGRHAIVSTFASIGPELCSNLPVRRYCAKNLAAEFSESFCLVG